MINLSINEITSQRQPGEQGTGASGSDFPGCRVKNFDKYFEFLKTKKRRHVKSGFDVLDLNPFLFEAIRLARRGLGHELKQSYFNATVKNIQAAESARTQKRLF